MFRGNQLNYPINPERMKVFTRLKPVVADVPVCLLGLHDGVARAGTRKRQPLLMTIPGGSSRTKGSVEHPAKRCEDIGAVGVSRLVGGVDCLARRFAERAIALDQLTDVVGDLADIGGVGRQLAGLADCLAAAAERDPIQLSDAFGDDVDMLVDIVAQIVQQFVDGDKGRPLQVPVRLLW